MFTGAPPKAHGMRSNFVPNLGIKCESIFDALRSAGMNGKLVGIAHLVDAFGHKDVETVTAVTHNDEIDNALVARAKAVMERDNPERCWSSSSSAWTRPATPAAATTRSTSPR